MAYGLFSPAQVVRSLLDAEHAVRRRLRRQNHFLDNAVGDLLSKRVQKPLLKHFHLLTSSLHLVAWERIARVYKDLAPRNRCTVLRRLSSATTSRTLLLCRYQGSLHSRLAGVRPELPENEHERLLL